MQVIILKVFLLGFCHQVSAQLQAVGLTTSDGVELSAVALDGTKGAALAPAVIFIHQGGSTKEEWISQPIFQAVADAGMLTVAFDIRGHGASGGEADFSTLFDDPNQSPRDVEAVIDWLHKSGRINPERIAIVGASIGANLAVAAAGSARFNIGAAVAISGKTSAAQNLAGGADQLRGLNSIYLIASELEQDGQRASWAGEMFALSAEPKRLEVVADSSGHGVSIFADAPQLQNRILNWLLETL